MSTRRHRGAVRELMGETDSGSEVGRKMVKISVEVRSGTARFWVSVQAQSIRRALSVVGARYPTSEVKVIFPIEPEGFFVDGPALAEMVAAEHPKPLAA